MPTISLEHHDSQDDQEEVWFLIRLNASTWASVSKEYCNSLLGLLFGTGSLFCIANVRLPLVGFFCVPFSCRETKVSQSPIQAITRICITQFIIARIESRSTAQDASYSRGAKFYAVCLVISRQILLVSFSTGVFLIH